MSFVEAVRTVLTQFAVFEGRARRAEYWYFALAYTLVFLVLLPANQAVGSSWPTTVLTGALLIPSISVTVRRLHDIDRSGWWALMGFVPVAGILLLVYLAFPGTPGDNAYGPDPRER